MKGCTATAVKHFTTANLLKLIPHVNDDD